MGVVLPGAPTAHGLLLTVTLTTKTAPVVKAASTTKLSTGAIVVAVLAALLVVVCLVWAVARWWAYAPRWTVVMRHSLGEAGWRLSGAWEEFSDWARLGR
jgi:hypothetical protein